MNVSYDAILNL